MPISTELMNCTRLTTGMFIPNQKFAPGLLNQLYADVTREYPYATLQHLPDGIRMANQENDCVIQAGQPPAPGRIQVNEANFFHFEAAKQKTVHLFKMLCEKLNIGQYFAFGVKLTAILPMEGKSASELIESNIFHGAKGLLDSLGPARQGSGLRTIIHRNGIYDLKIEPFFADPSNIFIELDVQHPEPFADLTLVDPRMSEAYVFLNEDVRRMLGQFT